MMAGVGLFIWNIAKPYLLWVLVGLVVLGTVAAVLARAKNAGRMQERVEGMQATIASTKRKEKVKDEVAKERRRDGESATDRLMRKYARD